jgi:hypothetical protein
MDFNILYHANSMDVYMCWSDKYIKIRYESIYITKYVGILPNLMKYITSNLDGGIVERGWCKEDEDIIYGPSISYRTLSNRICNGSFSRCPNIDKTSFPDISDDILQEMINDHKEMQRELEILNQ